MSLVLCHYLSRYWCCYPVLPFLTLSYPLLLFLPLLPCVTICYPFVTLCYLCYPVFPCVTLCYPLLPCVTLYYPVLPFVTLCFPLLPCVTLCCPLLPCVTLCRPLLPCATLCYPFLPCVTLCFLVLLFVSLWYPLLPCISIVCNFSWDGWITQEKWKIKVMQNFGRQIRCIVGDVQLANVASLSLACSRLRDEVGFAELRKREHEIKSCFLLSRLSPLSGIGIIDYGHNGDFRSDDGFSTFHWGGVGLPAGTSVSSERSLSMQTRWRTKLGCCLVC